MKRPPAPAILTTGATGYLGSHFVLSRLRSGAEVFCLARATLQASPKQRVEAALAVARAAGGHRTAAESGALTTVAGDVCLAQCGVSHDDFGALQNGGIRDVWHFASDLRFEDGYRTAIQRTNIDGARNAVALAGAIGARRFVYISTAYTAGTAVGRIDEVLHPIEGPFNNVYEETKCAAEHLVTAECARRGIALTILRPAIVIGPRATRRPDGSETGLYGFIHAVKQLRINLAGRNERIRVVCTPNAELNFVPVDCVVADMEALIHADFGGAHIRHLTSTHSVTVGQCWAAVSAATRLEGVEMHPAASFQPTNIERLVERRIGFFLGYVANEKRFVRSLPSQWVLTKAEFEKYVAAAARARAHAPAAS